MKTLTTGMFCAGLLALSAINSANAITVTEAFLPGTNNTQAEYTVFNDSGQDIYAFAVGNNTAVNAGSATRIWNAYVLNETQWNSGSVVLNFLNKRVSTSSIGLFSNLFAGSTQAVLYSYDVGYTEFPSGFEAITTGETANGFMFSTIALASSFVAVNGLGGIIEQGQAIHTSPVPVPAAVWLFGSGLIGLFGFARKKSA